MIKQTRLVLQSPDIHTQQHETRVRHLLAIEPGVQEYEVDYREGIIRVVTANSDGGTMIQTTLSDAGYPAEVLEKYGSGRFAETKSDSAEG